MSNKRTTQECSGKINEIISMNGKSDQTLITRSWAKQTPGQSPIHSCECWRPCCYTADATVHGERRFYFLPKIVCSYSICKGRKICKAMMVPVLDAVTLSAYLWSCLRWWVEGWPASAFASGSLQGSRNIACGGGRGTRTLWPQHPNWYLKHRHQQLLIFSGL